MQVLSRMVDETILIAGCIRVQVIDVQGMRVRLGIEAPEGTPVRRHEAKLGNQCGPHMQQTLPTTAPFQGVDVITAGSHDCMPDADDFAADFDFDDAPLTDPCGGDHFVAGPRSLADRQSAVVEDREVVRLSPELTRNRLAVHKIGEMAVVDFGYCEIWDGSDLCILRETLACLLDSMGFRELGINMKHAKSLASGFFGLLHDWHLRGVTVRLLEPQQCVREMLWFREFCVEDRDGWFVLERRPDAEEQQLMTYARLSRPTWRWGRPE